MIVLIFSHSCLVTPFLRGALFLKSSTPLSISFCTRCFSLLIGGLFFLYIDLTTLPLYHDKKYKVLIYMLNLNKVKNKDDLLYDLIFSDKASYQIDISEYIENIYDYEIFVLDIKNILKKSKVVVEKSTVMIDSKTAIWELKVKK